MKHELEIVGLGVGDHDKLHSCQRLVIVEFVLLGAIRQEAGPDNSVSI
jgi:hypothetical protein